MYTKNLPISLRIKLRLAQKQGLFDDIICPICGCANNLNWCQSKIKYTGLYYICDNVHCNNYDIIGIDIIEDAAIECIGENPLNWLSILYYLFC